MRDRELRGPSENQATKTQELFNSAKSFKVQHEFSYCWTKSGTVYLRKSKGRRPIKIKDLDDLQLLAQED